MYAIIDILKVTWFFNNTYKLRCKSIIIKQVFRDQYLVLFFNNLFMHFIVHNRRSYRRMQFLIDYFVLL